MNRHANIVGPLLSWFGTQARDLPWRRTHDPYAIWVSEVMLQQTQVKTVVPYWQRWMRALPTIQALARAKPERLHKLWEGLGYYTRVRNMQKAARVVVEKHQARLPQNYAELLELPGIGRYTAGAICSIALNQPKAALDGNGIRVLTRLFGIAGDPRDKEVNTRLWSLAQELVEEALERAIKPGRNVPMPPREMPRRGGGMRTFRPAQRACSDFNQSLMELGALVCTPKEPKCGICPTSGCCVAYRRGLVDKLPTQGRRIPPTPRRFVGFVVQKNGRFLVGQRPAGVVNAHMWEFPNIEAGWDDGDSEKAAARKFGHKPARVEPLCTIKHSITRYRITLEVYRITVNPERPHSRHVGRWLAWRELQRLPFASAHKKVLRAIRRHGLKG